MILQVFRLFSASTPNGWRRLGGAKAKIAAPACWVRMLLRRSHKPTSSRLLAFFIALLVPAAWAQVSGTISGKVEDSSGAAIRGVNVTVKSLETGATRVVNTDETGNFRVVALPLGLQEVRAEKTGFKAAVRTGINLAVGQEA